MHFGRICAAVHCRWSLWDQKLLKLDVAVTLACCLLDALFCTSALITVAGRCAFVRDALWQDRLLQCTFAGRCAFVRAAYFHGYTCSDTSLQSAFMLCSAHQL